MRFLVTGAAGFIGSHLVDRLLARGHEVVGLDCFDDFYSPALKRSNLEGARTSPTFHLVEGDIRDCALLERLLTERPVETVVHLAARAGVRPSIADPLLYQDVNVGGTGRLLEAMRSTGHDRLIFASSSSVYGNNSKVPFAETDPVDHPISPYAATKKACELLCHTYWHLFKLRCCCLRFFTVYGPRQRPEMAIHKFTRLINDGQELPIFGDGSSRRDYTYIDDIIQGIEAVIGVDFDFDIVNLGESQTTTLRQLVQLIELALGKKALLKQLALQPGDVMQTFADLQHARTRYGYSPRIPIADGIPRFVEWYTSHAR